MLECFYPKEYLDSTYQIDFEKLYRQGYRGILFDIDNTLVPHGQWVRHIYIRQENQILQSTDRQ